MKCRVQTMGRCTTRWLWLVLAVVWLNPISAWALDPGRYLSQYAHTAWRIQDGFFKGSPYSLVQTQDGYLWIGTTSGLLRFDGVRFVPWTAAKGDQLTEIGCLLAASDGSLWIGTSGGLAHWRNQKLTHYPSARVASILEDSKGNIWFGQVRPADGRALCQVVEAHVRCYGGADGVPSFGYPAALVEDQNGNLWVGSETMLLRLRAGSTSVLRPSGLKTNNAFGIYGLAYTPDGTLWVGIGYRGPGLGLEKLVHGRWESFKTRELDGSTLSVTALYLDRQGALWVGTADQGIYRIHDNEVSHFDSTKGLSSDRIYSFIEDREGNLWVTTSQGLDRFSDTPVISFSVNEGLCTSEVDTVLAARDGGIWIGGTHTLDRLRNGTVSCLRTGEGLPGNQVTSLLEDHAGRLWVGIDNTLSIYEHGEFRRIKRPDGDQIGFVTGIAEDIQNNIWVEVIGPPGTLIQIRGLTVQEQFPEPQLPRGRRVAADPTGGVWLGLINGDLAHYQNGRLATYAFAHDAAATVEQLLPNSDGTVLAATSYGVIAWQNTSRLTLTTRNGLPCDKVRAMTFDSQNNLWLSMDCGLVEITSADFERWWRNPDVVLSPQLLDVLDGVLTGLPPFVAAARSSDGRLWFATGQLLQMIDPAQRRRNSVVPPVYIEQVVADRKSYPVTGIVRLPPRSRDLEIDYVGLSFVAPQKALFRYRLEGRDGSWQEPGTRRQAFYSDLRPGTYRFRVMASNNDGLWNEQGAVLDFVIPPAWYQTNSFLALCVVIGAVAGWALYRLRMRQVAQSLSARFDERLAERTRVAREIHDTLLQTVQGSKMVADDALDRPDDAVGMQRAMAELSNWLGQAAQEGRETVHALRTSTTQRNDLSLAFRRAIEDCERKSSLQASLCVIGDAKEMHPVVRDEVYRIGYEAIRNACRHSRGSRLEVGLSYSQDLTVRVADNGVGIDPAVVDEGKEGHFGLQGLRERATRIGAKLTVVSAAGSGTDITLTVPGRVVFRKTPATLFERMRAIVAGKGARLNLN
jgi:signal transduction histidine kinase/ligand-binding sensor domain-containing protein